MDDKKTLQLILRFGLQQEENLKKAYRDMVGITAEWKRLQAEAEKARLAIKRALQNGQDARQAQKNLEQVEQSLRDVSMQAVETRRNMEKAASASMQQIGEKLSQIGSFLGMTGGALAAGPIVAAKKYLDSVPLDDTTARWKTAQDEIEQSYLRIGAIAADKLVPLVEKLADLSAQAAEFIEKNPKLIEAIVGVGSILAVTGGALSIGGKTLQIAGIIRGYAPGLGGGLANAGKAAGAFLTGTGGAVLSGIGLGLGGYEALAQSKIGKQAGLANLGQYASVAAYGVGSLFGQDTANRWFQAMGEMTGVIEKQTDAARENTAAQGQRIITQTQLNAFAIYEDAQNKRIEYETSSAERRNEIVQEFSNRRIEIETNAESQRNQTIAQFANQRAELMRKFFETEHQAEADYYRQRMKAAQQNNLAIKRAEENHLREMRKLQRDHDRRVRDLVDERDALGLVREMQMYEDQRQEAESNHRLEIARQNEDFAIQLRDMEQNFALQRQQRLTAYQEQQEILRRQEAERLAQIETNASAELKKLDELKAKKLAEYDKNAALELDQLRKNEEKRLAELRSIALRDHAELQRAGMEMTARYRAWLQSVQTQTASLNSPVYTGGYHGRANGGYVSSGEPYIVGERGPELFVPQTSGKIIPNHQILTWRGTQYSGSSAGAVNMSIETSTLTMRQVIREIDRRLARNEKTLAAALGG